MRWPGWNDLHNRYQSRSSPAKCIKKGRLRLIANDLFSGGYRDRTCDLLHAMQALSQLS